MQRTAVILASVALVGSIARVSASEPERRDLAAIKEQQNSATPAEVWQWLKEGNERFVTGHKKSRDISHDRKVTAAGQYPRAIILSCIDSRAPAELIFDVGLGDLFNARVAGNIVDADLAGSIEYACKVAGAKLVLVMGHTSCGAVKGVCDNVELGNLSGLLEKIKPAVAAVGGVPGDHNSKNHNFVEAVAEANVRLTVEKIREVSPILAEMERDGKIQIVGSIYDLVTGRVKILPATNASN